MKQTVRFLVSLVACLVVMGFGSAAMAQCPDFGVPLNLSYEVDAADIEEQILAGCDPHIEEGDNDWSAQGGTRRGSPGSSGASLITNVSKARMDCPPTRKADSTCEIDYPECTGRPGGLSVGGAESVCEKGAGTPTVGLLGILDSLFTGLLDGFFECFVNFLNSMDFSGIGGFIGSFVNNVTVSANAGVSQDGICAGGSIGFCGLSVGGEICLLDELGQAVAALEEGISFIEAFAPGDIFFGNNIGFTQGPVVMVDGGFLEGYGDIPANSVLAGIVDGEEDGNAEMGLYLFLPRGDTPVTQEQINSGEVEGTKIADLDDYNTPDPESPTFGGLAVRMNGLVRIPVENIMISQDNDGIEVDVQTRNGIPVTAPPAPQKQYDDSNRLVEASEHYRDNDDNYNPPYDGGGA